MDISKDDQAIIEFALKETLNNSTDYEVIEQLENTLKRLKNNKYENEAQKDGFRYDYDDFSI
ncbi:hypothetical protein LCL95_03125 [Bacillus timonensis]|nr:hypothetical protein [Bacillus timonensis]